MREQRFHSRAYIDAAKKLDASYPMVQAVDWANTRALDDYVLSIPATKASIGALLDAGFAIDMRLFQLAPQSHFNAFNAVDGELLTSVSSREAVTVDIAQLIASAQAAKIKAVFDIVPTIRALKLSVP